MTLRSSGRWADQKAIRLLAAEDDYTESARPQHPPPQIREINAAMVLAFRTATRARVAPRSKPPIPGGTLLHW